MSLRIPVAILALTLSATAYAQQHDRTPHTHDSSPHYHDNSPRPTGQAKR